MEQTIENVSQKKNNVTYVVSQMLNDKIPPANVNFIHLGLPKRGYEKSEESHGDLFVLDAKNALKVRNDRGLIQIKGKGVILSIFWDVAEFIEQPEDSEEIRSSKMSPESYKLVRSCLIDKGCIECLPLLLPNAGRARTVALTILLILFVAALSSAL